MTLFIAGFVCGCNIILCIKSSNVEKQAQASQAAVFEHSHAPRSQSCTLFSLLGRGALEERLPCEVGSHLWAKCRVACLILRAFRDAQKSVSTRKSHNSCFRSTGTEFSSWPRSPMALMQFQRCFRRVVFFRSPGWPRSDECVSICQPLQEVKLLTQAQIHEEANKCHLFPQPA